MRALLINEDINDIFKGKSEEDFEKISTEQLWKSSTDPQFDKIIISILSKRLNKSKAEIREEILETRALKAGDYREDQLVSKWIETENYEKLKKYKNLISNIEFDTYRDKGWSGQQHVTLVSKITSKMYKFLQKNFKVPFLFESIREPDDRYTSYLVFTSGPKEFKELLDIAMNQASKNIKKYGASTFINIALKFLIERDLKDLFLKYKDNSPNFVYDYIDKSPDWYKDYYLNTFANSKYQEMMKSRYIKKYRKKLEEKLKKLTKEKEILDKDNPTNDEKKNIVDKHFNKYKQTLSWNKDHYE